MRIHLGLLMLVFLIALIKFTNCINLQINTLSPKTIKISNNLAPIKEGCIVVYSKCDFEGERKEICGSVDDLRKLQFDKKISSIIVGINTKVILRQMYSFKGNGLEITSNLRCLENKMKHWEKKVSSLYISNQ